MANKEMSEWMLFFREAGIPAGPAASYANTFVDNRIQKNMLMDLTKEYLKDMGIGVMGDVIAILKHAKSAFSKFERERPALDVLPKQADGKVELKRKTTVTPKQPGEASGQKIATLPYQAGSRMLEHYMRKEGMMEGTDTPPKVKVSTEMAARLGAVPLGGSKKRIASNLMSGAVEVIPVKRIRKVDPIEEGGYIISMPKGTTQRTQKILQQKASAAQGSKSSVFARLGGGVSPAGTVPGAVKNTAAGQANVFNRLGGLSRPRERSLSEGSTESVVAYAGVLKPGIGRTQTGPKVVVTLGGQKAVTAPPQSLQDRLGIQKPEISTTTMTHMDAVTVKSSLQARLGAQRKAQAGTSAIHTRMGGMSPPAVKSPALQKRLGTHVNMSNLIQVPISDKATVQTRRSTNLTTMKLYSPSLHQRIGTMGTRVKSPPSSSLQARLGQQKKSTPVYAPKKIQTVTTTPEVDKIIITRPSHSLQTRLGGKVKSPPQKISLADRLGGKVNRTTAGVMSRDTTQTGTMGMASDRVESAGVMKRLGMPVSGMSSPPAKITFNNTEVTPPTSAGKSNLRGRLGVQKAEASSTTPNLGITVTTSGTGYKVVQAMGGTQGTPRLGGSPSKNRRKRKRSAAAKSGVFSRLGSAN